MKPTHQRKPVQPVEPDRVLNRRWIALLVAALVIASLLGTSSFQT